MAVSTSFLPTVDSKLLAWSANFSALLTATPLAFSMTVGQATTYAAAHAAFATALTAATTPSTRTTENIVAKDAAKASLKTLAGSYGRMIQANVAVTDAQKISLGLTVRATPTPIPAPSDAPGLEVKSVTGWTVKIKLSDTASSAKRGKPPGVSGANVFSFVGATAPADMGLWKFEGGTGKTNVEVVFPNTVAPGTKVWLTAFWFNGRKQSGPACVPVGATLQGGSVSMAA